MPLTADQVLSGAEAFVVKVGGDSAGQFRENRLYPAQMRERTGREVPVGLVVSAVRSSAQEHARFAKVSPEKGFNTTTHLLAMANALAQGRGETAKELLDAAGAFTHALIHQRADEDKRYRLDAVFGMELAAFRHAVNDAASVQHFGREARFREAGEDRLFGVTGGGLVSFTGFGERLAEQLLAANLDAHAVNDSDQSTCYLDGKGCFDPTGAAAASRARLSTLFPSEQGAVWVMGGALEGLMQSRGYSDVAAVTAMNEWRRFDGRVLVVAKVSPIMSVDPGISSSGRLVPGLCLNAATELFGPHGLDAGALHPDAVKDLRHPCVVYNPGDPSKGMTLVSDECDVREGVLVVGYKPIPALVRVSSPDMADRHGVFARVMDALREATLSHTYTSEGRIVVTVNNKVVAGTLADLEGRLRADLDPTYRVNVSDNGYTMVFALGNALEGARETGRACAALSNSGIKLHFQDLVTETGVMKFVVDSQDAKKAVGVLHEALVENAATLSS